MEVRDRHPRRDPLLRGDATQEVLKVRRFDEQNWGDSDERHQRPQTYQDPAAQQSMSGLQLLDPGVLTRGITQLRVDLQDGTWQRKNNSLLKLDALDVGWRLITTVTKPIGD